MDEDIRDEKKNMKFIDYTSEILRLLNTTNSVKRSRMKLNGYQVGVLENNFQLDSHPSHSTKRILAAKLSIPLKNIQIWFQNRRAKEKIIISDSNNRLDKGNRIPEILADYHNMVYKEVHPFDVQGQTNYYL